MATKEKESVHNPTVLVLDLINYLDQAALLQAGDHLSSKTGFIIGNQSDKVTGVLVCIDITEATLDEAIANGCNLVVAAYPMRVRSISEIDFVYHSDRCLVKALKQDIAVYIMHNNLDSLGGGASNTFANTLELQDQSAIVCSTHEVYKLTTFVPVHLEQAVINVFHDAEVINHKKYVGMDFPHVVKAAHLCPARADASARYTAGGDCYLGAQESALTFFIPACFKQKALDALFKAHPYRQIPYTVEPLETVFPSIGSGVVGTLPVSLPAKYFLKYAKTKLSLTHLKHTQCLDKPIKIVAIYAGNGGWLLEKILHQHVDAFITAGLRYADFVEASGRTLLLDMDHDAVCMNMIAHVTQLLVEKFAPLPVVSCQAKINPIHYIND